MAARSRRKYLNYAVRDVEVKAEAYFKLVDEFKKFALSKTETHQLYSEASLGKGHLREMQIKPLAEVQADVPPSLYGIIIARALGSCDPYQCDVFREDILLRGKVQSHAKKETDLVLKQQPEGKSQNLRFAALHHRGLDLSFAVPGLSASNGGRLQPHVLLRGAPSLEEDGGRRDR